MMATGGISETGTKGFERPVDGFSLRRARWFTLFVLIIVAAFIGLVNLSSEPVTIEFLEATVLKGRPAERSFGWPLAWYWRSRSALAAPHWTGFRSSAPRLAANLAVWLAMLTVAALACEWLIRRSRPRLRWCPRFTTLIVLLIVSAPTVLANLSVDALQADVQTSYGWPLIWYWHIDFTIVGIYEEWDYSAAALAANLAAWLFMVMSAVIAWEWLLRRYWPQRHFSLRTMLLGMALAAVLLAWFVAVRERAAEQDALAAQLKQFNTGLVASPDDDAQSAEDVWFRVDDYVYVEYRGPQWLDTIGAHRLRRSIVGVRMDVFNTKQDDVAENVKLFRRLASLPSLRFLDLQPDDHRHWPRELTPEMAAALRGMRQLRMLNFECHGYEASKVSHEYLAAIGTLSRLERLRLSISQDYSGDLACLSGLANLRTLAFDLPVYLHGDGPRYEGGPRALRRLPPLPRLEQLDVHNAPIADEDLRALVRLPRLKALNLAGTWITDSGLAQLAPLESLEELAIGAEVATAHGLEALIALKHLRALHIANGQPRAGPSVSVRLDDGGSLRVTPGYRNGVRRAWQALRQAHPGIVVDAGYDEFQLRNDLAPPWSHAFGGDMHAYMQRWLHER